MNTTAGVSSSQSFPSLINPVAEKLEKTVAYTPIAVLALAGNSLIGIIVCKTPTLRKPINPLIVNMAMSDLFYPIFLLPVRLAELHVGSCLIGGALGQALGKLHVFLVDVSSLVSIQSLILITVGPSERKDHMLFSSYQRLWCLFTSLPFFCLHFTPSS